MRLVQNWTVTADPSAVAPARHRALAHARSWGYLFDPVQAQMLELLVSEMVTNAILYGQPDDPANDPYVPIGIKGCTEGVLIIVRDHSHEGPSYTADPFADEHGWGVTIMQRLALDYGWFPLPDGKVVWALMGAERPLSREQRRITAIWARIRAARPQIRVHASALP
jgi:anti-sigma regulatory factor (Ser/Thr protein kinase)